MTAKGAATLGAFIGAAIVAGASALVAARPAAPTPIEELRKDIAEMKADIKAIKCRLNIEGTCPPSR